VKIRLRLALYGAFVTAIAMISFGVLLGLLVSRAAPEEQDRLLADLAAATVVAVEEAPAASLIPTRPPVLTDLATSTDPYVSVVSEDGTVLYATGQVGGEPPQVPAAAVVEAVATGESTVTTAQGSTEIRMYAMPWSRSDLGATGIVVAGQSTAYTEEQIAGLTAVLWVSGTITLIAAIVVSWLVSGRALRPLHRLAETTDEIGTTGDLSRRLPPVKADDEVGVLTTSFNAMLDRLEDSQDRLQATLAAQRRFVGDASHELRSPLTTIRSNAGFLRDRPDVSPQDREEALADIEAESDRMAHLIDDLLLLARADAALDVSHRPVDLAVVLDDASRRAARLGWDIVFAPTNPTVVMGDHDALTRLVWILLDNADKHGARPINVTLNDDGTTATLAVADHGPGIAPEHIDHVFERFYRADPARSPAGAGLGLAIAAEIVVAHGGSIRVTNEEGAGAAFTVRLPVAQLI
jgi:signal transduction histidine kinase